MTEPTPDFTTPPLEAKAGVRPWRENGYRLEGRLSSSDARKYIVHNYGHGGAGITLSWGVASRVRDLVRDRAAATGETAVAVLGSGVMGLTAATLIRGLGLKVTVYARELWEGTTSNVAGGQWAPSSVIYGNTSMFKKDLTAAYTRFARDVGNGFGVSKKINYTPEKDPYLDLVVKLLPGLIPAPEPINLPFQHLTGPGFKYETLLIETPKFLSRLDADLRAHKVHFETTTFSNIASVLELQENLIVNCTGLGAKFIWNDDNVHPIKGHLALLRHQPDLTYLFSRNGYLFPRDDWVIVGGTYCVDDATTNPDQEVSQRLIDHMMGVFGVGPTVPLPECHIDHEVSRQYAVTRKRSFIAWLRGLLRERRGN